MSARALAVGLALVAAFAAGARAAPPAPPEGAPPAGDPNVPKLAKAPADLAGVRAALLAWRLGEAEAGLAALPSDVGKSTEATILQATLDYQRASYKEVASRLTPLVRQKPTAYEARVVLGRALLALGKTEDAVAAMDPMADDYNDDKITSARDLGLLGVGMHLTGYFKNANRVFTEALDKDPKDVEAKLAWGDLFLSKYNYRDADRLYREVLAALPGDVRASVGVARVAIASDNAFAEASDGLGKVLAASPECVPAHNVLALIDLQNERPDEAIKRLEATSLRLAPNDNEALALYAAAFYLLDDAPGYAAAKKRALAVNPRFVSLYTTVAEHAERVHRYEEARRLLEEALALDPESGEALAGIGVAWSRLGDDQKARTLLGQAFDADPYNVKTYNLLQHFYDKVDKAYTWIEAPPMRVRVDKREAPVLERYVPRLLSEGWKHFSKKYAFKPDLPVHVEIFPDVATFAVRSVGLPGLAAHGICFGHVITARSPSAGDFNWAEVLWHEMAHVYHIQLSKSRVPRWFTEGFAVYESLEGRPSWRREMDPELFRAHRQKKLRGIDDFNLAFTQAKSIDDILVAYYHAYMVAKYLNTEFGFPKVKKMLELWGAKKKTPEVIQGALGVDVAELDRRFFAWLDKELSYLEAAYPVDLGAIRADADALVARVEAPNAPPPDARALALAAAAKLVRGDASGAEALAERALQGDPDEALALFVRGGLRLASPNKAAGRADFERLVALGKAGVDVRLQLAEQALAAGQVDAGIAHLEAAVKLDPQRGSSYERLVAALERAGRSADAFKWRARLADEVEQMDAGLALKLLDGAAAAGAKPADVLRWGELAVHVAPFVPAVHVAFAKAALAAGAKDVARYEAESALVIDPANAEARAILGR